VATPPGGLSQKDLEEGLAQFAELSKASRKPSHWVVGKKYVFTAQAAPQNGIWQCMPGLGHSALVVATYSETVAAQGKKPVFNARWWDLRKQRGGNTASRVGRLAGDRIHVESQGYWNPKGERNFNIVYKGETTKDTTAITELGKLSLECRTSR
jgi:hypothetical protein